MECPFFEIIFNTLKLFQKSKMNRTIYSAIHK